jgi:adenosylcobinamide-GDP ribazoletransferase
MNSRILKETIRPFLMAVALLTRLPVIKYLPSVWSKKDQGLSIAYYPLVGLLLALIIVLVHGFLPSETSRLVSATFIVFLLVFLTGALHLDGLADSVDAAFAAHILPLADKQAKAVNKEKILSIFKDPRAGPMAVVALVMVLLAKVVLLSGLTDQLFFVLISSLILPRMLASLYMLTTPYARSNGLASGLIEVMPHKIIIISSLSISVCFLLLLSFSSFLVIFFSLFLLLILWRKFWLKRIDGFVGDCVGALIEIGEILILFIFYIMNVV